MLQKQISEGAVGIPVKYLSGELLTEKSSQGLGFVLSFDEDFGIGCSEVDNSCLASGKVGYNCNYF